MKEYEFKYTDETEFKKYERSLKKYNMLAYKKLYFSYYPSIKEGKFLGDFVKETDEFKKYEVKLPTDPMFSKVHGDIKLHYMVKNDEDVIILDKITPEGILGEGVHSELTTYKGVMVSNQNHDKDMFKINLLNMLQK